MTPQIYRGHYQFLDSHTLKFFIELLSIQEGTQHRTEAAHRTLVEMRTEASRRAFREEAAK
jgi:hypothetical protein